jgi:serine/threonine protein kinase
MSTVHEVTGLGDEINLPSSFGRYTYVRTISCATTSVVLLVADRSGDRFAAKVVKRDSLAGDGMEYFERELRLLQLIRHPNIVKLRDTVFLESYIVLVMEFCEQGDLFNRLTRCGPLAPPTVRKFAYHLLKALQCLHEKGVAHRDLKPENILISSAESVKLADFGLAVSMSRASMMRARCGSLPYMAPEVIADTPYDGLQADIWSFGILLFVMTLNQLPWDSTDEESMCSEIIKGEFSVPLDLLMDVGKVIQMCTKANPAERPTVAELLALPWFEEEAAAYDWMCRVNGIELKSPERGPIPSFVAKSSVRMNLSKQAARTLSPVLQRRRSLGTLPRAQILPKQV